RLAIERDLQPGVPQEGAQVPPVQQGQPPSDVQPHPEQGLELGVGTVGIEIAGQVEVGLLEDVRGIEARPQSGVHAELDPAPQPLAIAMEQLAQRLAVAGAESVDQMHHLVRSLVHEGAPTPYLRAEAKAGPKDRRNLGMARTGTSLGYRPDRYQDTFHAC